MTLPTFVYVLTFCSLKGQNNNKVCIHLINNNYTIDDNRYTRCSLINCHQNLICADIIQGSFPFNYDHTFLSRILSNFPSISEKKNIESVVVVRRFFVN